MRKPHIRLGHKGQPAATLSIPTNNHPAFSVDAPAIDHNRGPSATYMRDGGTGYMSGGQSPFLFGWRPMLREPVDEVGAAWVWAAARMIDALHNSGWLRGGVDTAVSQMIGNGLQCVPMPDPALFGGQAPAARAWGRDIAARFERYGNDAFSVDLSGRARIGQLCAQGVRQFFSTGEILATLPFKPRPGATHGTKVNMLPSSRLSMGGGNPRNVQGVVLDTNGVPVAYNFLERDLAGGTSQNVEVKARDEAGRPVVLHVFDGEPTQVRGITPLVPVLRVIRQLDQLQDATLTVALIQTIVAGTITSDQPNPDVMAAFQSMEEADAGDAADAEGATPGSFESYMGARFDWYSKTKIDLGQFGKVVHLFPGETLNLLKSEHPNTQYESFTKGLLREIARCFGITYEQLTGDYIGATYSSVRMAVADMWLMNLYRRHFVAATLMQGVYESWLEEEIELNPGLLPGGLAQFYAQRTQICRCDWRGPPRPTADDLKTAQAQQVQRQERWVTQEQLCAEYGNDWIDVNEGAEQEMQDEQARKLPPRPSGSGGKALDGGQSGQQDVGQNKPGNSAGSDNALSERLHRAYRSGDDDAMFEVMGEVEQLVAAQAREARQQNNAG